MPRLIRMTSESSNGHFNNAYQAEIVLPPNSQMCLQNLTAKLPATMTIDESNSEVQFTPMGEGGEGGYLTDGPRYVFIPEGTYSESAEGGSDYKPFEEVLEDTLNSGLTTLKSGSTAQPPPEASAVEWEDGRRGSIKDPGGEWKVDTTKDKSFAEISYKQQETYLGTLDGADPKLVEGTSNGIVSANQTNLQINALLGMNVPVAPFNPAAQVSSTTADADKKSILLGIKPMAVGGGVFGARVVNALLGTGGPVGGSAEEAGIYMGFCDQNPKNFIAKSGEFDITGMKYGVQINGAGGLASPNNLFVIEDGVATDTESLDYPFDNASPLFSTKAQQTDEGVATPIYKNLPYVEFGWDMGRLELRTYQQPPGGATLQRKIVYQYNIDNEDPSSGKDFMEIMGQTKLYPVIIFASKEATDGDYGATLLSELFFTASPHIADPTPPKSGIGATRIMGDPSAQKTGWIKLHQSVQRYFSFPSAYMPSSAPNKGLEYTDTLTFIGGKVSTTTGFPENFVVELLTLPLDSYDGQELLADGSVNGAGQRKSILATIPQDRDENGVLRHETGDPYFIDLNNLEPILLRNIFLRLLDNDLDQVPMNGKGCITLLTREKGKQ